MYRLYHPNAFLSVVCASMAQKFTHQTCVSGNKINHSENNDIRSVGIETFLFYLPFCVNVI